LPAGIEKFGVRWNTVSSDACSAKIGIDWMPDEPVPITATRSPVRSTPSCGQWPVWYVGPPKRSAPGTSGALDTDRQPVAMIRYCASIASPVSVRTVQRWRSSSYAAFVTRVSNVTSRVRSKRSATCSMYRRISGCVGYFSVHVHSCSSSGENE
jgi:hypothetical protein